MKRPLAGVALLFAAGIFTADQCSLSLTPWLLSALAVAVIGVLFAPHRPRLLPCLVFLAGAANQSFHIASMSPIDLRMLATNTPMLVDVRGRLRETPSQRIYQDGREERSRTVAEVEVMAFRSEGGQWQRASGRIATSTSGTVPIEFACGSVVTFSGVLDRPALPVAPGLFDYRAYLRRHGIDYQLKCSGRNDWQMEEAVLGFSDRFMAWARRTLMYGLPREDEPLHLIWAMTLGWRIGLSGDVSEPFMRSGTMHIFAISGLHIALIATILVIALRGCYLPRRYCGWIVIPLIWFYTGATSWQASAIRSTLMSSIIIAGWMLRRPSDLMNSLAAAALIILVWDPQQLFQAGFLLSFAVVLSMALFGPILDGLQERWMQADPFLPGILQPRWMRLRQWGWSKFAPGVMTSTAAWLGSIPLVAWYFHLFTPVTLLANLVIVPMSSLALAGAIASLMVGAFLPSLAGIFNNASWFVMLWMVRLSEWFADLPGAYFYVPSPGILTVVLYGALVAGIVSGWLKSRRRRVLLLIGAITLAVACVLECGWLRGKSELTVLPLNTSHAVYVKTPREDCLVDCGNEISARFTTLPFLASKGVNHLEQLVLTHGDIDHVAGLMRLDSSFSIGSGCVGPVQFRSTAYRAAVSRLDHSAANRQTVAIGDRVGPWTVLHPAKGDRFAQADDSVLVLRGKFEGVRILLLSDLGSEGQRELIRRNPDLRAEIVVTGYPRTGEPLHDSLIEAISPRVIVLAEPPEPMSERRVRKLRARLGRRGIPIIDTWQTGAVTIDMHDGRWQLRPTKAPVTRPDESSEPQRSEPEE